MKILNSNKTFPEELHSKFLLRKKEFSYQNDQTTELIEIADASGL